MLLKGLLSSNLWMARVWWISGWSVQPTEKDLAVAWPCRWFGPVRVLGASLLLPGLLVYQFGILSSSMPLVTQLRFIVISGRSPTLFNP